MPSKIEEIIKIQKISFYTFVRFKCVNGTLLNKVVVNCVQQTNLGFGLFQRRAFGQCALFFSFYGITVFSGNFANHVGHYINRGTNSSPYDPSKKKLRFLFDSSLKINLLVWDHKGNRRFPYLKTSGALTFSHFAWLFWVLN